MSDKFEHPDHISVRVPYTRPYQYGVHSTNHHSARRITIRINNEDRTLIEKWAALLNLDTSGFIRESAANTAKELERLHNAYLKSIRSG